MNKVSIERPRFAELWKAFWNPDPVEKSQEEEILTSTEITEAQKKELLKELKDNQKMANKMFRDSYKTTKITKSKEEQVQDINDNIINQKAHNKSEKEEHERE